MESDASFIAADELQSDRRCARRLVIRIVLPTGSLKSPAPRRMSKRALLLIAGSVAVLLLGWVGVSMFRTDPTPTPAVSASAPDSESPPPESAPVRNEAAPVVDVEPEQPDAPLAPVNEVVPDVPQSALNTIRGTIRVSVRVTIDKGGTVVAATADEPGPSRYFERLAVEASGKWAFTPTNTQEQRTVLLRFSFTGAGVAARADLPE